MDLRGGGICFLAESSALGQPEEEESEVRGKVEEGGDSDVRGLHPPKVIIRNRWERKAQWKLGALQEGCGGAGSRDETRGGGPAMLHPALPGGGKWHEGGARRKGSLHDPFSPLTSGPFAVFLYVFFFFLMFLSSCYISKKQNKRQPVFEREWRYLENQAACTSPFAELLGFFAHLAAGARGASPHWHTLNGVPIPA